MMQAHIQIKLFAALKAYTPQNADHFPIEPGINVQRLLDTLRITGFQRTVVFVNAKRADGQHRLQGGERVAVFPPVSGG